MRSLFKFLLVSSILFLFLQCASEDENSDENNFEYLTGKDGISAADTFQLKTFDVSTFVIPDFIPANTFPYYENEKWGFANKGGKIVIPCQYDKCGFFSNGVAWVVKGDKYGAINKKGELIIDYIYDGVGQHKQGVLPVKRDFLWGFVDTTGKQLRKQLLSINRTG